MRSKIQGQNAISRIIEIREVFPKASTFKAKDEYANEFK